MNNYTKTVVSAVQAWTADQIKQSKPDWNQNDPNAADYIKNRTHYERLETKLLVDNLTREDYEKGNYPKLTFVIGNLYTVIWNGITYPNLECRQDHGYRVLGNPNQLYFAIGTDSRNDLFIDSVPGENYSVSIIGVVSDIKTIDPKFLPEGIGYDTREEKIIFSTQLQNKDSIYDLTKLSNTIEDIYNATHVSVDFPEYDFSLEKTTIRIAYDPSSRPHFFCPEIDSPLCVYFEDQAMADGYFDDHYRNNDDELNPLTPGLYIFDAPQRLSITLWNLSGELHTIDPKYLPDSKSDWNEANPESLKYIENRPFYENHTLIIKNLTLEDYYNHNYEPVTFVPEETYTVIWNGKTYSNLICWDDGGDHVIGNEPNAPMLPFWIDDNGGNGLDLKWKEELENVTVYQESGGEIKQIDEKFLPILSKQSSDKVLIDDQNIEAFNNRWADFNEDLVFEINPEAKYTIIFNNVEYTDLIPWYDGDIYVIGGEDRWQGNYDSEIPFASDGTGFVTNDYYDSYKLTIIEHTMANKIDPKYLPDSININGGTISGSVNALTFIDAKTGFEYVAQVYDGNFITYRKFEKIEITEMPYKTFYSPGQRFNPEGMVITGTYSDNTTATITNYSYPETVEQDVEFKIYCIDGGEYITLDLIIDDNTPIDFEYNTDESGNYILTAWKGTLNGVPSTQIVIPDKENITL